MFSGPLLTRELLVSPRHLKHFALRAGYVGAIAILMYTGAQATFGWTPLRSAGDVARFGTFLFDLVCYVQLTIVVAAALIFSAGSIAQEKDRRTLVLLLMTDLRAGELVVGKSLASLLPVFTIIAAAFPMLCLIRMLGGIELAQIVWVEAICLAAALAAGAWGTFVAYWREKTFQILSITLLGAGLFIGAAETAAVVAEGTTPVGRALGGLNPFRALGGVLNPLVAVDQGPSVINAWSSIIGLGLLAAALWFWCCLRVRVWNPSRSIYVQVEENSPESAEQGGLDSLRKRSSGRNVWETPILWREICTQAYGRKVGLIKGAYFAFAGFALLWLGRQPVDGPLVFGMISGESLVFVLLSVVALILVNTQSVTSLTTERDGQTLELLLVTEVSAREFVFSKLGGVLFNTKELIAAPLLYQVMIFLRGQVDLESLIFSLFGFLALLIFAATLGLHNGFAHASSRSAIVNSLGTVFFLFVGTFICMMLMVESRSSFGLQIFSFFAFIGGGSLGLWASLTYRLSSPALAMAAAGLPFLTFYAVVSYLLGNTASVFLSLVCAYGFTTAAMLVPAVSAFEVSLGRTTLERG